jgi:Transposase DDE domain
MGQNCKRQSLQQQRRVAKPVQKVDANHFFNLLTGPRLLQQVEALLPEHRERKFPPTVTLAMFLGQVMSADGSCQNAVNEAVVGQLLSGVDPASVNTGGYCQARARLPLELVHHLARHTGALLNEHTPKGWLWRGRHVKLVDGTNVSMPDTPENQACFPQHGQQEPGVGYPLARLVGVVSLSNGAVLNGTMGAYKGKGTGEHGLFRRLKDGFVKGDVMLADGYFCSYFLIADMIARGVDVLFEQHGARITDFRRGGKLGARDQLVNWSKPIARPDWMSEAEYRAYPDEITVREVKVDKKVLVTTLLAPRKTPKAALGELFWQRWNVELDLRNIKTTLGMENFSCLSPQMCEKEMWVYFLAYNLIRLLMAQAASAVKVLPRQLSFKHTLQIWIAWSQRQFLSEAREDTANLFLLIAQIRVGHRPGRVEPRMVKRRPKAYPRLDKPRWKVREEIRRYGHPKKLVA